MANSMGSRRSIWDQSCVGSRMSELGGRSLGHHRSHHLVAWSDLHGAWCHRRELPDLCEDPSPRRTPHLGTQNVPEWTLGVFTSRGSWESVPAQ